MIVNEIMFVETIDLSEENFEVIIWVVHCKEHLFNCYNMHCSYTLYDTELGVIHFNDSFILQQTIN